MQTVLGKRLRLIRAERKLSLRQAAREAGLAKETLGDLERGRRHPSDVTLAKLAEVYEIPLQELFDLEEGEQQEEPALAGKAEAPELGPIEEERWLSAELVEENAKHIRTPYERTEGGRELQTIFFRHADSMEAVMREERPSIDVVRALAIESSVLSEHAVSEYSDLFAHENYSSIEADEYERALRHLIETTVRMVEAHAGNKREVSELLAKIRARAESIRTAQGDDFWRRAR
jgi:putative transcriptional regulator